MLECHGVVVVLYLLHAYVLKVLVAQGHRIVVIFLYSVS